VHWQAPPSQTCPGSHSPPVPQAHPPFTQALERFSSQVRHTEPFTPQVASLAVWQVPLRQQPGQPDPHPVQAPAVQVPVVQDWQGAPPVPQEAELLPRSQAPAAVQHPPQEEGPHWQAPA